MGRLPLWRAGAPHPALDRSPDDLPTIRRRTSPPPVHGAQHPALAAALLYARYHRWAAAREGAEGLLALLRQPLARYEAHRLLARCAAASDAAQASRIGAVGEALRAAAAEAAAAGYSGLEQMVEEELSALPS